MFTPRTLFLPLLLVAGTAAAQPNTWVRSGTLNGPARHDALGFTIGDKVYTCLGLDQAGDTLTDLWAYDPALETWTEKAAFPGVPRTGAVTFTIGDLAYVATGGTVNDTLNDLWAYDPVSDAWTQKADMPGAARTRAMAFTIGQTGYITTGVGSPAADMNGYMQYPELGDLWAYDPAADTWTQKATLFNTYYYDWDHTDVWCGFVLGGKGFAIKLDYSFGEVWTYDPPSDSWSPRTTIDFDLLGWSGGQRGIGFALGNHGFLLSMGWAQDPLYPTHPNMFLRYSAETDTWLLMGYFSGLSRDNVALAAHEDVAYIMGGAHLYPWPDPEQGIPGDNYRMDLPEIWSFDIRDCSGIAEGTVLPGTPCNDGNSGTYGDAYDNQCTCTGAPQPIQPFHPDLIDNTFSTGTGFDGEVKALALQPDGKLIATGLFSTFNGAPCNGIARLNANGSLDEGFVGAIGGMALALQPDGRILVGANGIFRLLPDGSFDPDFNTSLNEIGVQPVNAVVVRPDGRIIAGGAFILTDEWGNEVPMSIMQLFQDGSLDNSFIPDLVQYNANVQTLVLRQDGKLLVGMDNESSGGGGTEAFNLAELNEDGSRSQQFNNAIGFSFYNPVHALALRPNGDLVVGGEFYIFNDDHHVNNGIPRKHLAVIDEMGYLSGSFDPGSSSDGIIRSLAVGPQGQIIAGGDFTNYRYALHSGIVQLNDYGYADASFQSGTGFSGPAGPRAFAVQPDGQLIVGGGFTSYNGTACGRITRLRTPGPICLPTQLTTTANPVVSCGAVNLKLNGTSTIAANEVPGANKYQFRFTNIAGQPAYARNIAWPTRSFTLTKWGTNPLKAGRTYNAVVRASFDDGATWCDYGPSCTVKVSWTPMVPGMEPRDLEVAWQDAPELLVYPNPTNGANLRLRLTGIDPGLATVTLDITDLFGKSAMTATLPINDGELDTGLSLNGDLSSGVYIARITAGRDILFGRFTLTR